MALFYAYVYLHSTQKHHFGWYVDDGYKLRHEQYSYRAWVVKYKCPNSVACACVLSFVKYLQTCNSIL